MTLRLDISIGPVQGFVAQSRRTRDLWGSSYLLSFLAGHAMRGAEEAGGRIVRPVVEEDALYRWIKGDRTGGAEALKIGSLPNRFAVDVDVDAQAVADAAVAALRNAWVRVCDAVWKEFIADAREPGSDTRAIWDRQINAFWEVVWTAGAAEDGLLARRKHWRSQAPSLEPGEKCTVMHDLQELSGYSRSTSDAGPEGRDRFWESVRERTGALDLKDNERLCAIALIKRLFPKVAEEALGWKVDRSRWPSTVHMAARPWLRRVESLAPDQARDYAEHVKQSARKDILSERLPPSLGRGPSATGDFPRLDANWFHCAAVEDEGRGRCPLKPGEEQARPDLAKRLKRIQDTKDQAGRRLGPPSSFYALLLADGDRLGRLVSETGGEWVGRALETFTSAVPKIVSEHGGETIYAGGDDVLAMLPVPQALQCAAQLAESYRSAFGRKAGATLSASVVFVHIRYPLGSAIRDAHRLLDNVAKDQNGRNSLAAAVLKPGGLNAQWATTWYRPYPDDSTGSSVDLIQKLADGLGTASSASDMSSALLYRIRELLVRLGGWGAWHPGSWGTMPEGIDLLAFLRAEIGHSLMVGGDESAVATVSLVQSEGQGVDGNKPVEARAAGMAGLVQSEGQGVDGNKSVEARAAGMAGLVQSEGQGVAGDKPVEAGAAGMAGFVQSEGQGVAGNEPVEARAAGMASLVHCLLRRAPTLGDGQGGETAGCAAKVGVDALLLARFLAEGGYGEHEA